METKEVPVHLLKELLESHEKVRQQTEEKAEKRLTFLDTFGEIINQPGIIATAASVACLYAAPGFLDVSWRYGAILYQCAMAVGTVGLAGGAAATARAGYNICARKERKKSLEVLGRQDDEVLLVEERPKSD
jgi:hypothetical protein